MVSLSVFQLSLPEDYPNTRPLVLCKTMIYHPNIDPTVTSEREEEDEEDDDEDERMVEDNVCLNLFDEWTPQFGLEDCIQGLLFLFYNPNLDDPLSPLCDPSLTEEEFKDNVANSLKGMDVDGYSFPKNCEGCDREVSITKDTADEKCNDIEVEKLDTEDNMKDTTETPEKVEEENMDENKGEIMEKMENISEDINEEKQIGEAVTNVEINTCDDANNNDTDDKPENSTEAQSVDIIIKEELVPNEILMERVTDLVTRLEMEEKNKPPKKSEEHDKDTEEESTNISDTDTNNVDEEVNETMNAIVNNISVALDNSTSVAATDMVEQSTSLLSVNNNTDCDTSPNICSGTTPAVYTRQSSKIRDTVITDYADAEEENLEVAEAHEKFHPAFTNEQSDSWCKISSCTFVAPDYDYMLNMMGAACFQMVKSFTR